MFSENRILSDLTVGSDRIPTFKDPSVDSSLGFLSDFVGCLDPIYAIENLRLSRNKSSINSNASLRDESAIVRDFRPAGLPVDWRSIDLSYLLFCFCSI